MSLLLKKRLKINFVFFMKSIVCQLGNCQAKGMPVKNTDYEKMLEYADAYLYDDIKVYIALYKCANTHWQRNRIMKHIQNIIVNADSFQLSDDLIEKFREFVSLKDFLDERDEETFDIICMDVLNFFRNQFQDSIWGIGQYNSTPEFSIVESSEELREVAEIIISTDMRMTSYQIAVEVLGA